MLDIDQYVYIWWPMVVVGPGSATDTETVPPIKAGYQVADLHSLIWYAANHVTLQDGAHAWSMESTAITLAFVNPWAVEKLMIYYVHFGMSDNMLFPIFPSLPSYK